ncbi:Uma2 family endonuclease [Phormidium sp. LEGE 05292]|uniref:Uma2 family endonuclease n=1 Tax=[Phormidium] sp. LEGE 05292 TaxID=767427 RepID=UPI00188279D5|nr:Uma2 family endonuclease [Phormidium sp. LEGE 05292]MBE9226617.1 Uma2 family endonuclease [Phormidium sp. LEGE 05292]
MITTTKKVSFAEYVKYNDGTDRKYELVNGELIPMSLGTGKHGAIIEFVNDCFKEEAKKEGKPWTSKDMRIGVRSPRGGRWDTSRIPDITVLTIEQWESLANREAVIELDEPPPILVVEVVSESTKTTDYRAKRSEYAVLGISEYWIVDPIDEVVIVCSLIEGFYDAVFFRGQERVISGSFPELNLSAKQVLQAGK